MCVCVCVCVRARTRRFVNYVVLKKKFSYIYMNAKNEVVMLCFARYSNKFYRLQILHFFPHVFVE